MVDYKTGSVEPYKGLSSKEPTLAGTKLQLPIYALGARAGFGNDNTLVHSTYWFTSNNPGRWQTKGYEVTDRVLSDFDSTIDIIINGNRTWGVPRPTTREHVERSRQMPLTAIPTVSGAVNC